MKTHDFARHLEQLARLLRQLPNTELDPMHASDLQGLLPGMAPVKRDTARAIRLLPDDIEDKLAKLSPAEIEAFLLSEENAFTLANLSELAERIGLNSSKRQSKSALVNMITRHYEASKMHSIMRGPRPNEDS
jgi:DNA-directed RNA polymerase specialized sigma24 family protein